jgi:hypothetical protein
MVNEDRVLTRQLMRTWFERAQIDYSDLFVRLYITYNVWFRKVTGCSEDHEAIRRMTERFVIWDDYLHGHTLSELVPVVGQIARSSDLVDDAYDWKGLIAFWYQTRCDLFHGLTMPGKKQHDANIRLAYESLNIFMSEIMRRMRFCFSDADYARLTEVKALLGSEDGPTQTLKIIEARLHQKFIHSPDLWNVDMERV